jgi:hypothetical protein
VLHEFAARARLYAHWDRKLCGTTRFFGAAAVTNAALVELCLLRCSRWWLGNAAVRLLSTAGRRLERLNIELARDLEHGTTRKAGELDSSLITLEQTLLERVLQQEAGRAPRSHGQAVQQINRLLFFVERWAWRSGRWPSAYIYREVLQRVRTELGRRPDFASLRDRVGIGHALIRMLQ